MPETETKTVVQTVQFLPFSSVLDNGFWHQLSKRKLDLYQLDESVVQLRGYYSNGNAPGLPPLANFDYTALEQTQEISSNSFPLFGELLNTNTFEKFRDIDKQELINKSGLQIWENITSGKALQNPEILSQCFCLTFADLKKYTYYYWFAFPALTFPKETNILKRQSLTDYLNSDQIEKLSSSYMKLASCDKAYFVVNLEGELKLSSLKNYKDLNDEKILLAFSDPSTIENYPGWLLRNFLALIAQTWGKKKSTWDILCYRERVRNGVKSCNGSIVLTIQFDINEDNNPTQVPSCVGWEKNAKGKLGPRKVDLSSSMDPQKLSESAVDLNLKLMKWRLVPDLNLEKISKTKCLLFGAGTLGCNVARGLIGWGIKQITFVDNGSVSYSNPVRQSLFTFDDCINGGKKKAIAAAEALKKIVPNIKAEGIILTIPMPGHSIPESALEQVKEEVKQIEELIASHDAIFLLTDTRESRWLPTVIAASKQKIVINSALGFDTFLVLRHGLKSSKSEVPDTTVRDLIPGDQLGCYFCNDVVAPGDSTKDRTLDQQCTVTRPGISLLASALAVELLISALQHPEGALAAADARGKDDLLCDSVSPLGIVPHQIRGFLSRFYHILPATSAFHQCTACSKIIMSLYEKEGFQFLLRAFNDPTYLEDVTGLKQLRDETNIDEVWELSDSDEE